MRVGILGIGAQLPTEVRDNSFWSEAIVESWRQKTAARHNLGEDAPGSPGRALVHAAFKAEARDPFRGVRTRRVLADSARTADLEIAAARDALERSGVKREEIELLLVHSSLPDFQGANGACTVHSGLELSRSCMSLSIDSAFNAFHHQVTLAESMISAGRARKALLVQSNTLSRALPYDQQHSAWFGDGATAVVVGPVSDGRGVLASAHHTDGSLHDGIVVGVPGKRWFDHGQAFLYSERPQAARETLFSAVDHGKDVLSSALARAGLSATDVRYFGCHQGFSWLREVTQQHAGMTQARAMDTFSWTGNLGSANIPFVLHQGVEEGLLSDGDVVATYAGGTGITWSSLVMRWGR